MEKIHRAIRKTHYFYSHVYCNSFVELPEGIMKKLDFTMWLWFKTTQTIHRGNIHLPISSLVHPEISYLIQNRMAHPKGYVCICLLGLWGSTLYWDGWKKCQNLGIYHKWTNIIKHPLSSCLRLPRVPKFCLMTMIKIWRFQSHEGRSFKPLDHDVVLKLRLGIHHFQKSMKLFYIILYTVFFAIKNY